MKIGKFAAQNALSIDTIRHYMDLGLIVPEKSGGQYDFDEKCQKDLEDVIGLKEMGFALNEVKGILLFKRLAKLTPYQENAFYQSFFHNKLSLVLNQISQLEEVKSRLQKKVEELLKRIKKKKPHLE